LGEHISSQGIPIGQPPGGHAVYLDARAFRSHIPPQCFPGVALSCKLYLVSVIQSVEIETLLFGEYTVMDLVRLTILRRVYTQSHTDYVVEVILEIWKRKVDVCGLKLTYEAPFLRHFTAKFERL
jgi:tryptophanase